MSHAFHGTTTTANGNWFIDTLSEKRINEWVGQQHGVSPRRSVWLTQVHSNYVRTVGNSATGNLGDGDGMITDQADVVLNIRTADCVPIFIVGDQAIGLGHAGMAGTVGGVLPQLIDALRRTFDASAGGLRISLGPHICGRCYEVSEFNRLFLNGFPDAERFVRETGKAQTFDMASMLEDQATRMGIKDFSPEAPCTVHDAGYYSWRRDHQDERMLSYVMLTHD